ncbi:MAG: restriction endonuclease subunit S [Thermacetogeniaceae bacterium]
MIKYKRYESYKDSGVEWIGEIPEHWEVGRLKSSIKSCRNGIWGDEPQGDNDDVACIRVADFNRTNMEIEVTDLTIRNVPASKQKMYLLKHGDLLIEKSGGGEKQPVGFVTIFNHNIPAVYANFIAKMELVEEKAYSGFYKYVHSAMYSVRLNVRSIKQTTGIQNLDTNYYFEESVIYPPLNEQKSIANFLDQKTAEIDGLIADKEKLIELLQEKRQAIITEAVTKGLNPNVRMKDSGIEWIGEIPEHWEVCGFTKYISSIIDYRGKTPEKVDEGVFLVTAKNIKNGRIDYSLSQEYVKSEEYEQIMRRGLPEIGDVVFTTEAPLGEVANVDRTDVAFAQRVIKFRGKVEKLDNYYLKYWIMSHGFQHDLQSYATGSTATGIKASKLSKLIILLPRLEEQKAIVNFLDQKTAEIDDLIFDIYTQIQKLKEYRQSLISEAVTGKIDVRDYVVSN